MISIPGTINIRTLAGRFGEFNVGTLQCSLGTFTVKDSTIDEFYEGSYTGTFFIETIGPNSYLASGRLVVEVRAKLNAILLNDDALPAEPETLERDAMEDEVVQPPHIAEVIDSSPVAEPLCIPAIPVVDDEPQAHADNGLSGNGSSGNGLSGEMAKLFGELWPLAASVKLDPTIDRAVFRTQKDHLKSIGYRFQASTQTWMLEGV
ncbi:MAG: DUF3275 family protein [Marinagarivorans sp.]|nr:DUF3275 family protein [Marinagarivorans sp.]